MNEFSQTKTLAKGLLMLLMLAAMAVPAYAEKQGIAMIDSFQGEVIMEIRGLWRKNPDVGEAVYHGDKVVTGKDGSVRLRFDDGSVLDIASDSNVRITQPAIKGVYADEELGKREIRVFVGKTKYESGERTRVTTRMVSPTAVAVLRGTIVEFGSDGEYSYLNRIHGYSDNKGNITEGYVPEITPEQSSKNRNYQASLAAWNAWRKYENAKKSSSPDANVLYAEVVKKISESLVTENQTLEHHPDELVRARAVEALKKSRESLQKAEETLKSVKAFMQKAKEYADGFRNQPENTQVSDLLLKALVQRREAVRDETEGFTQFADAHTASMYDRKYIEELERTTMRDLEAAVELAKISQKKVENLIAKALSSQDPDVVRISLESAEIFAAATEANAAVTDVAAKVIESKFDGDKAETERIEQNLARTREIAGSISDKTLLAEAVLEKITKSSANLKEASQELDNIQKEVNTQLKSLPLPPKPEVIVPKRTTTSGGTTGGTTGGTPSGETPGAVTTQTGMTGTSPAGGTLMLQAPPLQDAKKVPAVTPYGQ